MNELMPAEARYCFGYLVKSGYRCPYCKFIFERFQAVYELNGFKRVDGTYNTHDVLIKCARCEKIFRLR